MRHVRFVPALLAAALLLAGPALGQPAPTRVRGTIEIANGPELQVKTREGRDVSLRLADGARIVAVRKLSLADVKPGSYVGIAAMPRPDGSQMALEVVVFPDSMRGAGEGHRPWDLLPESTMTNATVASTVRKQEGETLSLTYKDGDKTVVIPPEAPIVTLVPADRQDLKPGARIFASATPGPDGVMSVGNIVVGRDGVDPPM